MLLRSLPSAISAAGINKNNSAAHFETLVGSLPEV
jgi:hypothetical protein